MPSSEKVIRITLRLQDEASKELKKSADNIKQLQSNLTSLGTQMTAAVTVPLVAAGAAGVKMAMDLDKAMRNIQSISKQTDAEIAALSDTFIQMSTDLSKTTDSAQNLAEAFYQIQGSGFAGADAMQILEVATKAASAGLTTTAVAAEGIVAVLNSYGLSAEHASAVSDIMFETVNRGVGSFDELSSSMSNVVGLANALGVPFEEVAAAMATMSKQGFTFAEASVAINQAMSNLLQPTAEGQKIIEAMGYASGQAMIDALGFAGSIQAIAEHTGGSAEEMGKLFSNVRGLRAALALTGDGAQMFSEDLQAMAEASGATAEAFAIQTQSFDAAWKNFQNTLNALLIEVGQVLLPVLTGFMQQVLIPLIQAFRSLPEPVQGFIIGLLGIVAAIGPLLLIFGQLASAIVSIMTVMPMIVGAFAAIKVAILGFAAAAIPALLPFLPIILAVVAAAFLLWAVATNFMGVRDIIVNAIYGMVDAIKSWLAAWGNALQQLPTIFMQLGFLIVEGIKRGVAQAGVAASQLGQIILTRLQTLGSQMYTLGQVVITSLIKGIASKAVDLLAYVFGLSKELTQMIKTALGISSPSKVMMGLGENVVQGFQKGMDNLGGLDVGVTANGRPVNGSAPALATAGAGGGGYAPNITNHFYLPQGSDEQTYQYIKRRMGEDSQRKGAN